MLAVRALLCLPVLTAAQTRLRDYLSDYLRLSGVSASCEESSQMQNLSAKSWDDAKSRCTEERYPHVTLWPQRNSAMRLRLILLCKDASCGYFVWNASGAGEDLNKERSVNKALVQE